MSPTATVGHYFEVTEQRATVSFDVPPFVYPLEAPFDQLENETNIQNETATDLVCVHIDPLDAHYINPIELSPLSAHYSPLLTCYMILSTHSRSLQTY